MNNPAKHNLDDVTLRAEDGEIVIETDSGEITATVSGSLNIDDLISAEDGEFQALKASVLSFDESYQTRDDLPSDAEVGSVARVSDADNPMDEIAIAVSEEVNN